MAFIISDEHIKEAISDITVISETIMAFMAIMVENQIVAIVLPSQVCKPTVWGAA